MLTYFIPKIRQKPGQDENARIQHRASVLSTRWTKNTVQMKENYIKLKEMIHMEYFKQSEKYFLTTLNWNLTKFTDWNKENDNK